MSKKQNTLVEKAMLAGNQPAAPVSPTKQKPFSADAVGGEPPKPRTGIGRMGLALIERDAYREQLEERAKQAEAQVDALGSRVDDLESDLRAWNGALPVRKIDPKRIKRSSFANRIEESFKGPEFASLKADIASSGGNVQPIKVRELAAGKYEIVFGHRRHQACLELGLDVLAIVETLTAEAHFIEMLRENQAREDLSPFETGLMYRQAKQVFKIQDSKLLAQRLSVSESQVSRAIKLVDLPPEIIAAFPSRLELQYNWATSLNKALKKDRDALIAEAKRIARIRDEGGSRLSSKDVLKALETSVLDLAVTPEDALRAARGSWHVAASGPKGEAHIREDDDHFEVKIPAGALNQLARDRIQELLDSLLT